MFTESQTKFIKFVMKEIIPYNSTFFIEIVVLQAVQLLQALVLCRDFYCVKVGNMKKVRKPNVIIL